MQLLKKIGLPLGIILISVVIAGVMIGSKKPPEKKEQKDNAPLVKVVDVQQQTLNHIVKSQGTVEPRTQTTLSTQVRGTVLSVSDSFVEGGFFNKGDLLVQLDPADYQTDLKSAEANLAQARAALEEEKARGKVAAEEWKTVKTNVPPELGLRKPQLARELANVQSAEAMLERARRDLERTEIRAPYDGLIKMRHVDVGQYVSIGSQIVDIYSTEVAEVRLPLSNVDLSFLSIPDSDDDVKEKPQVKLSAFVAGKQRNWNAFIDRSEGIIDGQSRVTYAVAVIEDPYQRKAKRQQSGKAARLSFGQFVSADITGDSADNIVTLSRNYLAGEGRVMVVNNGTIEMRPIEVVRTVGDTLYITNGLSTGDRVTDTVISNPYDGMSVRVQGEDNDSNESEELLAVKTVEGE